MDSTPLLAAIEEGHVEVVKALLEAHADPKITDSDGDTALMFASVLGDFEIVDLLLQYGSDINEHNEVRF